MLIAVNPFKSVPALYTPAMLEHYKSRNSGEHQERFEPHIFLTADRAYKEMCRDGKSQSLIVNGESGAGKTETTKIAMRYLAGLAGALLPRTLRPKAPHAVCRHVRITCAGHKLWSVNPSGPQRPPATYIRTLLVQT